MPRTYGMSLVDVSIDDSGLRDSISDIEDRLHQLESNSGLDDIISDYLRSNDYVTAYDVVDPEDVVALERRVGDLEKDSNAEGITEARALYLLDQYASVEYVRSLELRLEKMENQNLAVRVSIMSETLANMNRGTTFIDWVLGWFR